MSKKNKNKFRKHLQAKILQEVNLEAKKTDLKPTFSKTSEVSTPLITKTGQVNATATLELENLPMIRMDLLKTGITMAVLAGFIALLAILDAKYHILLKFGDILFKTFNIN